MEYILVMEKKPQDFKDEVNRLLSKGWELYGHPFHQLEIVTEDKTITHVLWLFQAMTKDPRTRKYGT